MYGAGRHGVPVGPRVTTSRWPGGPESATKARLGDIVGNRREAAYWHNIFESVYRGDIDTWDYQWLFANWLEGRLSILPAVNMISNVGFDKNATHTIAVDNGPVQLDTKSDRFSPNAPPGVFRNIQADQFSERMFFRIPLTKRVRSKLVGWLR